MSEPSNHQAFGDKSDVPIAGGLYYLAFLLFATLGILLVAGGVVG